MFKSVYRKKSPYPSIRLLVEPDQIDRARNAFTNAGATVVERGWINSETTKSESDKVGSLVAVHITYMLDRSPMVSRLLDQARATGAEVYEPVHDQICREKEASKPRELSPIKNYEAAKSHAREM